MYTKQDISSITRDHLDTIIKYFGGENGRYITGSLFGKTGALFGYTAGVVSGICRTEYKCCKSIFDLFVRKYQAGIKNTNDNFFYYYIDCCGVTVPIEYPIDTIKRLLRYAYRENYYIPSIQHELNLEDSDMISLSAYELKTATDALAWLYCHYGETFRKFAYTLDTKELKMFEILEQPAITMFNREKSYYKAILNDSRYTQIREMLN